MTVLGIPQIGVLEPIDVGIEPAVGIHVHVGDEICIKPSLPPPLEFSWGCILFGT
jgi:hypothetical protein